MSPMRSFDPVRIGRAECAAWVAYYQRDWRRVLRAAVTMVRAGFRMSWPRTLFGALLVLRANQVWAPYPDNDPVTAERLMRRFYRLVAASHSADFDPAEAARRELAWWRAHRHRQRDEHPDEPDTALTEALGALYGYLYRVDVETVRPAARLRAEAMRVSDGWVAAGCPADSPVLVEEQVLLVRSYAALLAAVHLPRAHGHFGLARRR